MKLVIATRNRGKAAEIAGLLEGTGVEVVTLNEYPSLVLPPETGDSFRENALIKARFVAEATGLPALSDDSGLEVDALSGAPGVFSARYAGEGATDADNYVKLLAALEGVPEGKRTARFRCAAAFVEPGKGEEVFEGEFEGEISTEPRGSGGFGYDPVFVVPGRGLTVAELPPGEKDRISHRAKALRAFRDFLAWKHGGG
ncbi:MAG: XTP/dITP diphosphatase [Deltaproteobacteria bacterium]|nr:XTP/dITP diphosphatase [Deltaproteobacteria bacterium]MBZ0219502.1 XTP/dITP diphosphatase [Deltaproteobacteria bacterium]